ncbi:hypothetical protein JCM21900_003058 [Sporobolomyces salmonicolor]
MSYSPLVWERTGSSSRSGGVEARSSSGLEAVAQYAKRLASGQRERCGERAEVEASRGWQATRSKRRERWPPIGRVKHRQYPFNRFAHAVDCPASKFDRP